MPTISMSEDGTVQSPIQKKGTYYCSSLAMTGDAQNHFIKVDPGEVKLLKVGDQGAIYTDSLQSCFPVVIKFKNGDIALYHGNNSGITKDLVPLLKRKDVMEIDVFEKESGSESHAGKVHGFTKSVMLFFQKYKNSSPEITVSPQEDRPVYSSVVVCKSPEGEVITCLGQSSESTVIAKSIDECVDKSDEVKVCARISAKERHSISKEDMQRFQADLSAVKKVIKEENNDFKEPPCIIM